MGRGSREPFRRDGGADIIQLVLVVVAIMSTIGLAAAQAVLRIPEARYRLVATERLEGWEIPGQHLKAIEPGVKGRRPTGSDGPGEVRIMFEVKQLSLEAGRGVPVEFLVNGHVVTKATSGIVVISAAQGDLIAIRPAGGSSFAPESAPVVSLITSYPPLVSPGLGSWQIDGPAEVELGNVLGEMD